MDSKDVYALAKAFGGRLRGGPIFGRWEFPTADQEEAFSALFNAAQEADAIRCGNIAYFGQENAANSALIAAARRQRLHS